MLGDDALSLRPNVLADDQHHFDKVALGAACRVHERAPIETTWLDSVRVAKRAWPELSSHRLNVLSRFFGIRHKHHDALSDARAAGMVVVRAIEHSGIDLAGWLSPARATSGPAPEPAPDGPLRSSLTILGGPRNGPLGILLAQAAARVVASVGTTTTMLVVSRGQPFGRFDHACADHRKAEDLRPAGSPIEIVDEDELRNRIGASPGCSMARSASG